MIKTCSHCQEPKLLKDFYRDCYRPDGYSGRCKKCQNASTKSWRNRNPSRCNYPERTAANHKVYRIKQKELWEQLLVERGLDKCFRCGYAECFAAIDFHHVNPEQKDYNVARLLYRPPTPERIAELDKVIALCARCHRELHAGIWSYNGKLSKA